MKKIVALALALVMVLGLATVASAATTDVVGEYEVVFATDTTATKYAVTSLTKTDAVAPVDGDEDGVWDEAGVDVTGQIAYYTVNGGSNMVPVASAAEADCILYVKGAKTPYMYLADVANNNPAYFTGATLFTDFGKGCDQFNYALASAEKTYYLLGDTIYVANPVNGALNFMVDGKIVTVDAIGNTGWVAHTPVYTQDKTGAVTAIACAKCDAVGVICANYASLPTAIKAAGTYAAVPGSASKVFYWAAAAVEAPADKVESAQTFDAGIAMYVGMSVMAAAGSAVVLKKKD